MTEIDFMDDPLVQDYKSDKAKRMAATYLLMKHRAVELEGKEWFKAMDLARGYLTSAMKADAAQAVDETNELLEKARAKEKAREARRAANGG
jgi:hypothetical protein